MALVTGGGTGLGRGMALALARPGANVALAGRRQEPLEEAATQTRGLGRQAAIATFDVTKVPDIERMGAEVYGTMGRLDLPVNNAGTQVRKPALEITEADWDRVGDPNLKGAFFCATAAARLMKAQGGGRTINIASMTSEVSHPNVSPYTAGPEQEWAPSQELF